MLGPYPQPLKIPLCYQKLLKPCSGGRQYLNQNWRNCVTRCRTAHLRSGPDESREAGVAREMQSRIGLRPATNWASRRIWRCSWWGETANGRGGETATRRSQKPSRRDRVIVAWQFIARNGAKKDPSR